MTDISKEWEELHEEFLVVAWADVRQYDEDKFEKVKKIVKKMIKESNTAVIEGIKDCKQYDPFYHDSLIEELKSKLKK